MNDYQDLLMSRVREASRAAAEQVLAAAPPDGDLEDLIGGVLHAATAAAADVWFDAMLYGDHPPPHPSRAGAVPIAGGLLVNPADYRATAGGASTLPEAQP